MSKGNLKSEQLLKDGNIILDHDTPIRGYRNIENILKKTLGDKHVSYKSIDGNSMKTHVYNNGDKDIILLCAAISYMGGNGKNTKHPSYLKRIQIKPWWKDFVIKYSATHDIRFLGIYTYKDTVVYTDIVKDTYMKNKLNNSSAHIYINDLYNANAKGYFKRIDQNNNTIISVSEKNLSKYLNNQLRDNKVDVSIFKEFNKQLIKEDWILAIDSIKEMKNAAFPHWKQAEWPGWSLEYQFNKFLENHDHNCWEYAGRPIKGSFELDFDLWSNINKHYGDLKSSDVNSQQVLGNDALTVKEAIEKDGKLWYIVYEHETRKDKDYDYEQTLKRNYYILEEGELGRKTFNEYSYKNRMKHSIKYVGMFILELSNHNYLHYLEEFHQGKQPDGASRKVKIKFSKHFIQNAIIYSERF